MAQPACPVLLTRLCDEDRKVSLETGGALDISCVDPRVSIVMDLKTPGSGESLKNRYENIRHLSAKDQVKFVVCDRNDYEWAKEQISDLDLAARCEVLMSPVHGAMRATSLADWILSDGLPVRMQVQLHKLLWGDARGH